MHPDDATRVEYVTDRNTLVEVWINRVSTPNAPDVIHLEVFQAPPGMELKWGSRLTTYLGGSAAPETSPIRHRELEELLKSALNEADLWESGIAKQRRLGVTLLIRRDDGAYWSEELGVIRVKLVGSDMPAVYVHQQQGLRDHHEVLFRIFQEAIAADGKWNLPKPPGYGGRSVLTARSRAMQDPLLVDGFLRFWA